jgi:hypothetical protein
MTRHDARHDARDVAIGAHLMLTGARVMSMLRRLAHNIVHSMLARLIRMTAGVILNWKASPERVCYL